MHVIVLSLKQIDENHNKLRQIFCKPCHCAKLQTKVATPEKPEEIFIEVGGKKGLRYEFTARRNLNPIEI